MNCIHCTFLAILIVVMGQGSFAFAPQKTSKKSSAPLTFQYARVVPSTRFVPHAKAFRMASSSDSEESSTDLKPVVPTSGTFYDDEVDPIPVTKQGISESMKERLLREASTGLDSDQKQSNVILYIMAAITVLVLLGGKDILY